MQTSIVGRWLESGVKLKCVAGSSAPNPPTYGSESATDEASLQEGKTHRNTSTRFLSYALGSTMKSLLARRCFAV